MQQEDEWLASGLSEQQRETLQNRVQNLNQLGGRMNTLFRQMDESLHQNNRTRGFPNLLIYGQVNSQNPVS